MPLAVDVPDVELIALENPHADGPFGAKGVAEAPIAPVAGAVANAVADAIGAPINHLPITPESVLQAIQTART